MDIDLLSSGRTPASMRRILSLRGLNVRISCLDPGDWATQSCMSSLRQRFTEDPDGVACMSTTKTRGDGKKSAVTASCKRDKGCAPSPHSASIATRNRPPAFKLSAAWPTKRSSSASAFSLSTSMTTSSKRVSVADDLSRATARGGCGGGRRGSDNSAGALQMGRRRADFNQVAMLLQSNNLTSQGCCLQGQDLRPRAGLFMCGRLRVSEPSEPTLMWNLCQSNREAWPFTSRAGPETGAKIRPAPFALG
mmetsp:Transcript_74732/g.219019  ORF Transcript_74732/g.219019 Transcript_74732/m.219019 type:complete len:250 (-) Transcript_74732:24-773(-)